MKARTFVIKARRNYFPFKVAAGIAAVLSMSAFIGCSHEASKPTVAENAKVQWNGARASVLAGLGKDQFESGSFEKARITLNEAIKLDPENAGIRSISARLAIEQGQFELADRELRLARQFDPRNAEADFLSGVVHQRWQKIDVAFEFYSKASEKAPTEISYLLAKSEMLDAMNRSDEALNLLQEKVIYFEHSAAIRDEVGQLLLAQKRYKEAAEMLRQASGLTPEDLTIKEHLGLAQFYAHLWDEAVVTISKLLKEDRYLKRTDLLAALGESQFSIRKFRDARDSFQIATQMDQSVEGYWLGFGKASLELGDFKRCELCISKSYTITANSTEATVLLGYLRLKQDKLPEALAAFQQASSGLKADALNISMTGYVLEKMGRKEEARQFYVRALKKDPQDELALKLLASLQE